jgi:hypothetical protein
MFECLKKLNTKDIVDLYFDEISMFGVCFVVIVVIVYKLVVFVAVVAKIFVNSNNDNLNLVVAAVVGDGLMCVL